MTTSCIGATLCEQYGRGWTTLRDALSQVDAEQFSAADTEPSTIRNIAYHIVETADFYSSDCEADDFAWGHFTAQDKDQMLLYLEQVQAKMKQWLLAHDDQQFLERQSVCKWTGASVLDRSIYVLRHTQHHLGQMNSELRRGGLPSGKWQ